MQPLVRELNKVARAGGLGGEVDVLCPGGKIYSMNIIMNIGHASGSPANGTAVSKGSKRLSFV